MATRQEILDRVREKYPEYQDVPDDKLATGLASKYPEYSKDLGMEQAAPPSAVQESPIAEQEAFKRQLTSQPAESRLNQALGALVSPMGTAYQTAKGMGQLAIEGIQGAGQIAEGENALGSATQTVAEVIPRQSYHIADIIRQAAANPRQASEALGRFFNPVGTALTRLISPEVPPTPEQAQAAYETGLVNRAFREQAAEPIAELAQRQSGFMVPVGRTNIPTAEAIPLALGAENLPGAIANLVKTVGPQVGRTVATLGSTPMGSLPAASKAALPFLTGERLAGAQEVANTALAREAAIQRSMAESAIKGEEAVATDLQSIIEARGGAATRGREALTAGRELRTAQGTITPEIVGAQASIQEAAQMPPVILGRTAVERADFGGATISAVEKPMAASNKVITDKYTAVKDSLPEKQPKVAAQPLFDAASQAKGELSQGFEAHNGGKIKSMIAESSRMTKGPVVDTVPPLIRSLYENSSRVGKEQFLAKYPALAEPATAAASKIPEYTWSELQTRFRNVNESITEALKYGNVNDARILGDLKDGIVKSMDNYASQAGPETMALFEDANKTYAAHQDKFGLNRIKALFKDDVIQNPEYVADKLITYDNPSQVNAIKNIVSAEEFVPVQAQFSKKFFSPNPDVPFDPAHFVKEFNKPGARETVKAVFGEKGLNDFTRIHESSKAFAKIDDLQKALDRLATESKSATEAFTKARKGATEAEFTLAEKNRLKERLRPTQEAAEAANLKSVRDDVAAAAKELDRVKNYRDLKDWATMASGLNIVGSAATSPAWIELSRYAAIHMDQFAKPPPERRKR